MACALLWLIQPSAPGGLVVLARSGFEPGFAYASCRVHPPPLTVSVPAAPPRCPQQTRHALASPCSPCTLLHPGASDICDDWGARVLTLSGANQLARGGAVLHAARAVCEVRAWCVQWGHACAVSCAFGAYYACVRVPCFEAAAWVCAVGVAAGVPGGVAGT